MLQDRIIGALTFRKGVYAEVENDTTFTMTAWMIVAAASFVSQLVAHNQPNLFKWLFATILGTVFMVIGFALAAFVIDWVGRTVFYAEVTFEELVRTLGLAYVWQAVGILGFLGTFINFIIGLLTLAAWLLATKEALDLEWVQTAITVVIGIIVLSVFWWIAIGVVT